MQAAALRPLRRFADCMVTFLTIAFDPSFTGESGGTPRYMALPDINTEDFQAAVASAMYDVSRVNANGYFDGEDSADARSQRRTPFRSISWSGFFRKI